MAILYDWYENPGESDDSDILRDLAILLQSCGVHKK